MVSCVLFYGGEWNEPDLIRLLSIIKYEYRLRTCLYTGEEQVSKDIASLLTFIKTGCWKQELGGLKSSHTNQIFLHVSSGENLNYLFTQKQSEILSDTINRRTS